MSMHTTLQDLSHQIAPALLLGFTGPAGSGKDTCAAILQRYGFRSIAFADALRAEVAEAWRIDLRMLTDRATKEWHIPALAIGNCADGNFVARMHALGEDPLAPRSPRWVMQRWGTQYRRQLCGQDYWTRIVAKWVGQQRGTSCTRLCITDVRFADEAGCLHRLGGHQIVVHRPDIAALSADTRLHESEQLAHLPIHTVAHNDGDIEHLHAELLRVLSSLDPWHATAAA